MKWKALILAALLALQGCTVWDMIKPSSGVKVDTEVVVGDKKEEIATGAVVGKKEETNNTADSLVQTYNSVNEQYPWWVVVLLILGWSLPTPGKMFKGFIGLFRRNDGR